MTRLSDTYNINPEFFPASFRPDGTASREMARETGLDVGTEYMLVQTKTGRIDVTRSEFEIMKQELESKENDG